MQSVRKPVRCLLIVTCPEKLPSKYFRRTSSVRSLIRSRSASLTLIPLPETRIVMWFLVLQECAAVNLRQPLRRSLGSPTCSSCRVVAAPTTESAWLRDILPPYAGQCRHPPPSAFRRWRRRKVFHQDSPRRSAV